MKVLFAPIGTVSYNGDDLYYSSAVYTQIQRYKIIGSDISVLLKKSFTDKPLGIKRNPDDGVNLIYVERINSLSSLLRERKKNADVIKAAVKNCDVCVCHVPNRISTQVIKYANLYKKPYMTVVVACPWDSLWNYDWRGKLLAPFAFISLKRIQRHAKYSIYVTKEFLQRRYPTKGVYLSASDVDMPIAESDVLQKRLDRIEMLPDNCNSFSIGTIAALIPYKGQRYVIKALPKLNNKGFHYTYHIIGGGNQSQLIHLSKRLNVQDQVVFHGPVSHDCVFGILDELDLYVQPSKQEGLPRAMVEAMSRGCVVLGSNIAGIPELVRTDFLFRKGNVCDIVRILSKVKKEVLREGSSYSYYKAKEYDTSVLQKEYYDFLVSFRWYCENINILHL